MELLSIDPGKHTGWCLWRLDSASHKFGVVAAGLGIIPRLTPDEVIVEHPEIYLRSKARPNDIVKLAFTAGRLVGRYDCNVVTVLPKEWKGSLDKDQHNRLVMAELLRRLPSSHARVTAVLGGIAESYRNNVIDAVGLGLWHAKRLLSL